MVVDAAGLGSAAHRVRLFRTNWCTPDILQAAILTDILPNPLSKQILHEHHVPTIPTRTSMLPFAQRYEVGKNRVCMPTIVSYPKSHAFQQHANGEAGDGQHWNTQTKCWEEPTLEEREPLMGYKVGSTDIGLATPTQRMKRLGQAMDGNGGISLLLKQKKL